ncbi:MULTISPECIES: hypothetical protein [unclassified Schlesneria]|uniref:hypothetical protein n=1 Tax=Schlesneria TaxID=656899 RepID=UPI002EEF7CEB
MLKSPMMCSLLMAFGISAMILGCEPAKQETKTPPPLASSAPTGGGSTTGGGAEVPATPSTGAPETPAAPAEGEPAKQPE